MADLIPDPPPIDEHAGKYIDELWRFARVRDIAIKALGLTVAKHSDFREEIMGKLLEWANTRDVAVKALGYVAAKTTDLNIREKLLNKLCQLDPEEVLTITTLGLFVAKIQDPNIRTTFIEKIAQNIQYHNYKVVANVIEIIVNKTKDLDFRKDFVNNLYDWFKDWPKQLLYSVALGMIANANSGLNQKNT